MTMSFTGRSGYRAGRYPYSTQGLSTWGTASRGTKSRKSGSTTGVTSSYKNVSQSFQWKIESYRTLVNQTRGPAKFGRPSTLTLNSFANWVNKGAVVQTVSCAQVAKWARSNNQNFSSRKPTVASCKNVLARKFGKATIKACARSKSGSFMVVTSPTWKGKPFKFPH